MIKSFIQNSAIYTLGTILTKGMAILLVPIYTRYLSPSEYGVLDLFVIIASIVNLVIALEISQSLARYYQEAKSEKDKIEYVSTAFLFTLFMYFVYFLVSLIFSDEISFFIFDDNSFQKIFILASCSIATSGVFNFTQNQLKWQIQPKNNTITSIINALVVASIAIYLLVFENLKVESIFIGQIIGNILASLLAIYYAKNSYKIAFSCNKFKEMIVFSYPLVFSSIAVFVSLYIDRIAIKSLLGFSQLGVYGIAYRFAAIVGILMIGFQNSLTPLIYKNYKNIQTPKEISKIFDIFVLFALVILAGSIVLSEEVLVFFTTKDYYEAKILIPFLVSSIFFSNMYLFTPGLWIFKKTKQIALISTASALINTILNFILIPKIGIVGAAIATLVSSILTFLIYAILSQKYYFIPYKFKKALSMLIFVLIFSIIILIFIKPISISAFIFKILYLIAISIALVLLIISKENLDKIKTFMSRK